MTTIKNNAKTVYINAEGHSFGTFCYNESGDLFLNSDWGMFGFGWRSYGEGVAFKDFLLEISPEYLVGKFELNWMSSGGKKLPEHKKTHIKALFRAFQVAIKENVKLPTPPVPSQPMKTHTP